MGGYNGIYWVARGAQGALQPPPFGGASLWLVGWPFVPVEPPERPPRGVVTWRLLSYIAFRVAGEASSGDDAAAKIIAGLGLYRERLSRGLSGLYPVRGHRLWATLAGCPEGGVAPLVRSPRVRLSGGRVYGVIVDYARDGEPLVDFEEGGAGEATVEGGRVKCPGGRLASLASVRPVGRLLVGVVEGGSLSRPPGVEASAAERAERVYRLASPQLEALGLLPGAPRGGLSWLARRGASRLHEVYAPRAALAVAFALRAARGPGELLSALLYAVAASPWARAGPEGFSLGLQRMRPDYDLHWEVDPLSKEGILGAVEAVALLAAAWAATGADLRVVYAAPSEPEALIEASAAALPEPPGAERAMLAEEIASHWAPPGMEPPPWSGGSLEAVAAARPPEALVGGPPGSGWVASAASRLLAEGYRVVEVYALIAYGPRASWLHAALGSRGPGVLEARVVLEAREAARRAARGEASRGSHPGTALDRGASEALSLLTRHWPLARPDGSRVAVRSLISLAASGALEGLAEAYAGDPLDGPTRFYLALRLLGPLPREDAELLASAAGEPLARLGGLVVAEESGVVAARRLEEVDAGETIIGRLAAAARGGAGEAVHCGLVEALARASGGHAERGLRRLAARCRGAALERWLGRGTPLTGAPG